MLVKLVLVTCLGITTARPKMRGGKEQALHTGGAIELMKEKTNVSCTAIIIIDSTATPPDIVKDLRSIWEQWQAVSMFMVNLRNKNTTINDNLSTVISMARQVRQMSWCTMVLMVSHEPNILIAFAEWSLKGRLLEWTTKLVVVTRLSLLKVQVLLSSYWTFSMMNTVFLITESDAQHPRSGMYTHLPYSPDGSQVVKTAFWTPARGFTSLSPIPFFTDKFYNFYSAVVNVTAKPFMPYWGEKMEQHHDGSRTTIYYGSDYQLLAVVASAMNFTVRVMPTPSWAEVTKLVEKRISFIAPVIHMVLTERREKYDFSYIYETSHASFAVAKPGLEPQWKSLYYPLDFEVWMALTAPLFLVPFLLGLLIRASHDGNGSRDVSVGTVFQDMVGIFLGQGLPYWLSSSSSTRVVVTTWLIFAFIIATAYRSNLTAALTLPKYSSRPETLQEIVDTVDMVTLPAYGEQHRKFYSQSKSPLFQALGRLMKPGPSLMEGLRMALVEKSCHTEARKYLQYEILDKFTERDGSTRLYVSSGSIFPSPSAWPIPHDAPYKAHLNRWIVTTLEAGLYEKWIADLLRETKLRSQRRQRQRLVSEWSEEQAGMEKLSEGPPILTLSHTQGGFIIFMLGLILATFAFIQEFCSLKPLGNQTK